MSAFSSEEIQAATGAELVVGSPSPFPSPHRGEGGVRAVSTDSRTIESGELFIALRGERFDGHEFLEEAFAHGAAGALVERWPLGSQVQGPVWKVPDTLRAFGHLARFHRDRFSIPVVAITGSTGKSTTKAMLTHLLSDREEVLFTPGTENNRIGVPRALLRLGEGHGSAVLELGTNRWGEIRGLTRMVQPTVGLITNIGPAHLETFGDLKGVLRAKGELWEEMDSKKLLVLNADDPLLWEAGQRLPHTVRWFSATGRGGSARLGGGGSRLESDVRADRIVVESWGSRCRVNDRWGLTVPLPGHHNLINALGAIAVAEALGRPLLSCVERLKSVPPLPGRLVQTRLNGCLVLDDTYNANPASLKAALEVLSEIHGLGRRVVVLGDMLELGEQAEPLHREAGRWMKTAKVDLLVTVGRLAGVLLVGAWESGFSRQNGRSFDTAEEAGEFLREVLRSEDTVLIKGSRAMRMERVLAPHLCAAVGEDGL